MRASDLIIGYTIKGGTEITHTVAQSGLGA